MTLPRTVRVAAPAKVNLFLRVLDRRPDGFHELDTLLQGIELRDDVEVTIHDGAGVGGTTLEVEGAELGPTEENLAWRAADALLREVGSSARVHVRLRKRIPAGGGLGGGSSDAAAVLRALDMLLEGPLPPGDLSALAATLGSDVPFFLQPTPLARGQGRGERLEALAPLPPAPLVLVLPPVHVATRVAYAALAELRGGGGAARTAEAPPPAPRGWDDVARDATNDFERVVPAAWPEVEGSLAALREAGASPVLLSGSGGACFGLVADPEEAARVARSIEARLGWPALVTRTLDRWPPLGEP